MSDDVLVRVDGVSKKFCRSLKRSLWYGMQDTAADLMGRGGGAAELRSDEFWAVDDVSFELKRGECLGLIGRNGAGKTTLLKMLNGLIKPDRGRIEMRGRVGALIALGAGFNPILTGRENIYVNGAVLGLSKREIDEKIDEIINFAEIGDFIDAPVQSYSSGMQVRLGFAVATAMEPDVLLLDEVLAVGDANFQAKCYQRLGAILDGAAVILVSHYAHHIKRVCDKAMLLDRGDVAACGDPEEVLTRYARATPDTIASPLVITGRNVVSAQVLRATKTIEYGGNLELRLSLQTSGSVWCDQAYLNIADPSGAVHTQVVLSELAAPFESGDHEVAISVGPLFLSQGAFVANLMMLTSGGKETLLHIRNSIGFETNGPLSLGARHYPPAEVKITSRPVS